MKLFFDFFPILLFFIAFKIYGIYVATAIAMAASILQVSIFWLKHHRVEATHMITLAIIMVLGGATLLFHDIMFIKWKPTVIYWIFASLFLITRFVGNKTLIQRMMDGKVSLPEPMWHKLNLSWALFFLSMGFINLYVVYHYDTNTWVNFKLFGTLGLTVVFVVLQSMYMAKGIKKT